MKILITSHQSEASGKLAYLLKDFEIVFGDLSIDFPKVDSVSLAHEILKFSLDHSITHIYPTRHEDLAPLRKSKILFDEFDIKIMTSNDDLIFNNPSAKAESYASLSTKILSLDYPNQKIALGDSTGKGNLISIDDNVKDFSNIWIQIKSISFIQMGKLFNNTNFEIIQLYTFNSEIKKSFILINENQEVKFFENFNSNLQAKIISIIFNQNYVGFFVVDYDSENILRIRNAALSC
ncbi:hypothetical protein A5893_08820 [Pedobacter psychrophilus]|uniref:Uncharacterized protein n=1 Tax=Pedobacter psychrophilus TaxID=1826909 RepID=A0A179DF52_9SPHI|nr:hypothetical protein [Pedobacter psychrophilus]OAQ39676.1 hypothetical protein A5893_08820 [Pedobacter psychrophilus]